MPNRTIHNIARPISLALMIPLSWGVLSGCGNSPTPSPSAAAIEDDGVGSPDETALEKTTLKLGFIKLTDCAPLVIAKEKGFFEEEGLDVELEAQANWKVILDRVISGELDGAHLLAGQPIGASIGIGTKAPVITALSLDLNGNGVTLSNRVWKLIQEKNPELATDTPKHPIHATVLKPVIEAMKAEGRSFNLGMVFPLSTHNYELRYWLAAGGIHPGMYSPEDTRGVAGGDVVISVTPPPQMPATVEAGTIDGYCVGEPWNQQAVAKGIGVTVITDYEIWKNNPEKVFGVTKEWNDKHPSIHVALVKAIIKACQWLDVVNEKGELVNRQEACEILSKPNYVGADKEIIANSMTGTWLYQKTDKVQLPEFNVFFKNNATYPFYSDCIWYLTQMRRWGQIAESKSAQWYQDTAKEVYRPDIYMKAAKQLIAEGVIPSDSVPEASDGCRPATAEFIDGIKFDARQPIEYLGSLPLGNKD